SIARSAMRWAALSENPSRRCSSRTLSAKTPPPGTTIARPPASDSSGSQDGRPPAASARLPPILTTRGAAPATPLTSRAPPHDGDADAARRGIDVKLLHRDGDLDRAWIGEAQRGDALRQRLDEVDMSRLDDRGRAVDDCLVIENAREILG